MSKAKLFAGGIARHLINTAAASVGAAGVLSQDDVTTLIGAAGVILSFAWSAIQKWRSA